MSTILSNIKQISAGKVADIVTQFSGLMPGYNWKVQNGNLGGDQYGVTSSLYDRSAGAVTTTFDASKFSAASDLSVARTMMHEAIHAYLIAYFSTDQQQAKKTYPQLYDEYIAAKHPDLNDIQHDQMVTSYIQELAYSLQQYGTNQGYSLADDFCIKMAWGGLEGTHAFQSLSNTTKQQIQDVIRIELTGNDSSGNPGTQKGKPAKCP